jgi:Cyclin, N-terminal domain
MIDLTERLAILIQQELTSYRTEDYMDPDYQRTVVSCGDNELFGFNEPFGSSSGINETWREKICDWSYQVIDHFDFSREVVSVALHYLDRYLSKRQVNKKVFQLATMTSLFLAIKLFEPGRISMTSMIDLSRGFFTVDQMVSMELSILR